MNTLRARPLWLFLALSLLAVNAYLGASAATGYFGFALDDAWIHQTYARNLGTRGEFAFLPGQPSAGSTAPLWSALIAVGYALRLEPRTWTYALGGLSLLANAWLAHALVLRLWPEQRWAALGAGVAVVLEWHLVWASVSGMETALFAALALAAFVIPTDRPLWLGVAVGVATLTRPDGLTLLPFVLFRLWLERRHPSPITRSVILCCLSFTLVFSLYLGINYWLDGTLWPNTFYAKQAEYAIYRERPLWQRVWEVGSQPFIGAQMLLLPGLVALLAEAVFRRRFSSIIPLAWAAVFITAYVLRLPVTYPHGRYHMPVIPVIVALGVGGMVSVLRLVSAALWPRVLSRAWLAAFGLLLAAFAALGAEAYRRDVRVIETEMVATARWIAANTEPVSLIAAHDIGALGYFGHRRLLDLAGLISPEVIPFIRDETRLRQWVTASGADYLVTLEGWYPEIERPLEAAFRTASPFSPALGGQNMVVYRWR
ncbi:MAG: hypothetical protein ACT4QE_03340 [Anaerolineales bacterium]